MFQLKVFKYIFLAALPLFIVVGFILIKSNTARADVCAGAIECGSYSFTCGSTTTFCSFCVGDDCPCFLVCQTCYEGREISTNCCDPETGTYLYSESSECDTSGGWCNPIACPNTGCYNDFECAPDDGCTDIYCDTSESSLGTCRAIDLCPGGEVCGNGVCEIGETNASCPSDCPPGGSPNFNVDIVQAPGIVSIEQGQVATYDINIAPSNNYSGTVNLSVSGCPATATCAFLATSTCPAGSNCTFTNNSPNPGTSVLTVSNTANITPGTYPLIVTGTDTAPEPDLISSDSSSLTVSLSSLAICDSQWRDIPWGTSSAYDPYGIVLANFLSPNQYSAAQDNSGVSLYSLFNYSGAFTQGGYQYNKCTFWGPTCIWGSLATFNGQDQLYYTDQIYAQNPSNIFIHNSTTGNNWNWNGSSWNNLFATPPPGSYNTPHSIIDKDGRLWNFQIIGSFPYKPQYKCAAPAPPTCSGAGPVGWTTTATTGTHDVFAYGVSSNVTAVKFPTWGDPGGQDDIAWYPGTDMGGGTWKASVNLANHKAGDPEYGNINVHIYMDTASTPNTYCGSATFTRNPPNQPPTVPSVTVTEPDYCTGPGIYVNWTYSDPDGDPQSAYQVQIDDQGSAWNAPYTVDSGKISGSGTSYFASGFAFNTTYKARVRVWDSRDAVSSWKESGSWKTPKHAYPYVDFTYSPLTDIPAKQPVQFTDQTVFYDGGGSRVWNWLFRAPALSPASNQQNPNYTYNDPGSYSVSLTATDKDNYSCSRTKPLTVAQPVPVWKEVSPR